MKDFYEVLGVPPDASHEDIKAVYRKKMLEYHPDRNPSEEAQEKAKSINEAWSVIGDAEKRKQYDFQRSHRGPRGFPGGGGFHGSPFDSSIFDFMRRQSQQPRRGGNVQLGLKISLYESIFGTKKNVEYSYRTNCNKCKESCSNCGGTGMFSKQEGPMMVTTACSACGGSGFKNAGCDECSGGTKVVKKKVEVSVPPGVKEGSKIGLAGAGFPGQERMPPGDLIIHIDVEVPKADAFTDEQKEQLKSILGER